MRLLFGLEAQGHIPTILDLMKRGKTWPEIAKHIGWSTIELKKHWRTYMQKIDEEERKRIHHFVFGDSVEYVADIPAPPQAST